MTGLPDLTDAFERSGLVDVAYAIEDGPVGPVLLASTASGLARVAYVGTGDQSSEEVLIDLARRLSPRVVELPGRLDRARRELDEFFAGKRREFDLPLDWSMVKPGFTRAVLEATATIPFGETTSYKGVGGPRRQRASVPRSGNGARLKSAADRGPVPSRAARRRRHWRLHRRHRDQAHAATRRGRIRPLTNTPSAASRPRVPVAET